MALVIYDWYDLICLVIVGAALVGSIYVLVMKEGAAKCDASSSMYQSLLVGGRADNDVEYASSTRGHVSYSQLWTSCWRGLHPACLLGIRFSCFVILCGCLGWDLMEWDASIFFYYTEWTFTLVIIYFGIGTIVSAHGCVLYYYSNNNKSSVENLKEGDGDHFLKLDVQGNCAERETTGCSIKLQSQYYHKYAIQQPAGFWGYLMQISYQTCAGAIILTDIIFWCVIVPFLSNAHLQVNLLMGSMHTLNAFFLLVDTSVNSLPFPWFRLSYFVLWSCCYVIFQWVIHACGYTWWPYPFLELSNPWAPFWYLCLAVIHIPCYGIYSLFVGAKNSIFSRLFPDAFVKY